MRTHFNLLFALILFMLVAFRGLAQQGYRVQYAALKEYEGKYEYVNNSQLEIVASPKDTLLYAVIQDSPYPLRPQEKDVFHNNASQPVVFIRNAKGVVTGYQVKDGGPETMFKKLSTQTSLSEKSWYPRIESTKGSFAYTYATPKNLQDGLSVGTLQGTGLDPQLLKTMVENIVKEEHANIHSVLIIKDGKLVFEEYFYEYDRNTPHQLRSATKSFVSALVGIAIEQKIIKSKEEKVISFFPEYQLQHPAGKEQIKIEHLLTNQSGLDCDDHQENSPGNESKMAFSPDWVKFTLDLPVVDQPGNQARYCSGGVVTLGRIIEKASQQPLLAFANKHLFEPLGISQVKWNFLPDSTSQDSNCQLYLRSRDMAKFGLLFLNNGKWGNKQVVSSDWVKTSLTKHTTLNGMDYGYLWWGQYLNVNGIRYEGITAKGNGGQRIYLWPDLNMVTVITSGNYNTHSPSDQLLSKYILPASNKNVK